jgi:hypothetical protein
MNTAAVEQFLARLYTDADALQRFLQAPQEEAGRAGLGSEECAALARADMTGLQMAAASFAGKRQGRDGKRAAMRGRHWILVAAVLALVLGIAVYSLV